MYPQAQAFQPLDRQCGRRPLPRLEYLLDVGKMPLAEEMQNRRAFQKFDLVDNSNSYYTYSVIKQLAKSEYGSKKKLLQTEKKP